MSSAPGGGVLRLLLLTFQSFYRELILYIKIHETFNVSIKLTISAKLKVNKKEIKFCEKRERKDVSF